MINRSFISARWGHVADNSTLVRFIDVTLRGCAQVMFQNNPLTGLLFFIAIFIGAYSEAIPAVAWGCLLATATATLAGKCLQDSDAWRAGLYGYNGCLVGVALPVFMADTPLMWVAIILASVISVIMTACIADILKPWKIAALTGPFVLTTWIILLACYSFSGLKFTGLPQPALPHMMDITTVSLSGEVFFNTVFKGISEVFLFSSVVVGILFVLGLAIESLWAAVFAVGGSVIALFTAIILGGDGANITTGLYAFSAVLTAIALGSTFNKPSLRVVIYTFIGVIFTVFVQGAMNALLLPVGIPTLTMPFVLSSWLFLLPNKDLMPAHRQ